MAFIDATALNVALPALQAELGATGAQMMWVINAYGLFVAALLLFGGAAGDRWGRQRVYVLGTAAFALTSLACGVAPNTQALIATRCLQGIAAAIMIPGSLAMITATVPPGRRGKAIGWWTACSVIASALGPVLGGAFASAGWWRGVFFVNLPLAGLALACLCGRVPVAHPPRHAARMDIAGVTLGVVGLALLNYGLIQSGAQRGLDGFVLGSLLIGLGVLVLFVLVESRTAKPILPLQLFVVPELAAACVVTLLFYSGLYGMTFFLSLNLIQLQTYDELLAGLAQLPLMLLVVIMSPWAGRVVDRRGPRFALTVGPLLAGFGYLGFAVPDITAGPSDYWRCFLPPLLLLGVAMGTTVVPLSTTVMNSVPVHHAGLASALNSTLSRLSSVLGVAVLGPIALWVFAHSLTAHAVQLPLDRADRAAVVREAARLGEARPPANLPVEQFAAVEQALDRSFVQAFRAVSAVSAAAAWLSAIMAAWLLDRAAGQSGSHSIA
jgi:EmrB/QacA subfamily drug resistance transporter